MASNKFATMLHRNTNKFTMILVYAVLEWILISLLLLNSLFSYMIIKFAEYVGLKPPCLWCSRVDHVLESKKKNNMHKDLLCEAHAKEVSLLGFCSNHQKLTETQDLCEDCLCFKKEFDGVSQNVAFFGMVQSNGENCSCCGGIMVNHVEVKPSWDVLEYGKKEKGELISEVDDDEKVEKGDVLEYANRSDEIEKMVSYVNEVLHSLKEEEIVEKKDEDEEEEIVEKKDEDEEEEIMEKKDEDEEEEIVEKKDEDEEEEIVEKKDEDEEEEIVEKKDEDEEEEIVEKKDEDEEEEIMEKKDEDEEEEIVEKKDEGVQIVSVGDDPSDELLPQHLEFLIDCNGHGLVPVELMDSATEEDHGKLEGDVPKTQEKDLLVNEERKDDDVDVEKSESNNGGLSFAGLLDSMEIEEDENSLVFYAKGTSERKEFDDKSSIQQLETVEEEEQQHSDVDEGEDDGQINMNQNEADADVSIGTEIPDLDHVTDEIMEAGDIEEEVHGQEDHLTSSVNPEDYVYGKEQATQFNDLSVEVNGSSKRARSLSLELSDIEEDRVPDTPTSVDSLHNLHKKLLLLEKRDSGTEDSLDGSVTSDFEGIVCDGGVITVDQLKSAVKAERKAFHAIYSELEEERNASAVSANQTMAMINRLHEEKAAMQMEALQYQRMMEEQAEYDQEALQLLNELMVKREKEKEELEKELNVYRKKVLEFETKEKLRMLRSGFSSPSCSNAEESDAASIDLNQDVKEEDDGFYSHRHRDDENENTPVSAVVNLDDSIADFEGERLSILEQLKGLEEKLMTLDDDDDEENYLHEESNGNHVNGFLEKENVNSKYHVIGPLGKSLLPLFDATSDENGDILLSNGHENGFHDSDNGLDNSSCSLPAFEEGNKRRFAVEDELDHLYERLQALEADREFLKHCISSLNKGDKGMHLLHEILHHLKDLRNVDLHVRTLTDSSMK